MIASKDANGFLIDGFPRNEDNWSGWNKQMGGKVNEQFVLFLSCPVDVCIDRCLHRGQGRTDDNVESLKKRVETYNQSTFPIIEHFEKVGMVREVNSERPVTEVCEKLDSILFLFFQKLICINYELSVFRSTKMLSRYSRLPTKNRTSFSNYSYYFFRIVSIPPFTSIFFLSLFPSNSTTVLFLFYCSLFSAFLP